MLRPRIIPSLLIHNKGLIKSTKFKDYKYLGDPINAVKIYNEKEVDELMITDIDATSQEREPNYEIINKLANECRMPLSYGGGIKSVSQALKIVSMGVEKVTVSSEALIRPNIITEISDAVGSQSISVVLDVKKNIFGKYNAYIKNGRKNTNIDPVEFAQKSQELGAGEIVLNSIDKDGTMKGYDMEIIKKVRESIELPMTVIGGAGKLQDIEELIDEHKIIGAAAGSLFVFKGKYKAVLINYPLREVKEKMFQNLFRNNNLII